MKGGADLSLFYHSGAVLNVFVTTGLQLDLFLLLTCVDVISSSDLAECLVLVLKPLSVNCFSGEK